MKALCWLGFHLWNYHGHHGKNSRERIQWPSRICGRCDHREILVYVSAAGVVWEQVT